MKKICFDGIFSVNPGQKFWKYIKIPWKALQTVIRNQSWLRVVMTNYIFGWSMIMVSFLSRNLCTSIDVRNFHIFFFYNFFCVFLAISFAFLLTARPFDKNPWCTMPLQTTELNVLFWCWLFWTLLFEWLGFGLYANDSSLPFPQKYGLSSWALLMQGFFFPSKLNKFWRNLRCCTLHD